MDECQSRNKRINRNGIGLFNYSRTMFFCNDSEKHAVKRLEEDGYHVRCRGQHAYIGWCAKSEAGKATPCLIGCDCGQREYDYWAPPSDDDDVESLHTSLGDYNEEWNWDDEEDQMCRFDDDNLIEGENEE